MNADRLARRKLESEATEIATKNICHKEHEKSQKERAHRSGKSQACQNKAPARAAIRSAWLCVNRRRYDLPQRCAPRFAAFRHSCGQLRPRGSRPSGPGSSAALFRFPTRDKVEGVVTSTPFRLVRSRHLSRPMAPYLSFRCACRRSLVGRVCEPGLGRICLPARARCRLLDGPLTPP
jgi:hypothetical protein